MSTRESFLQWKEMLFDHLRANWTEQAWRLSRARSNCFCNRIDVVCKCWLRKFISLPIICNTLDNWRRGKKTGQWRISTWSDAHRLTSSELSSVFCTVIVCWIGCWCCCCCGKTPDAAVLVIVVCCLFRFFLLDLFAAEFVVCVSFVSSVSPNRAFLCVGRAPLVACSRWSSSECWRLIDAE